MTKEVRIRLQDCFEPTVGIVIVGIENVIRDVLRAESCSFLKHLQEHIHLDERRFLALKLRPAASGTRLWEWDASSWWWIPSGKIAEIKAPGRLEEAVYRRISLSVGGQTVRLGYPACVVGTVFPF